MQPRQHKKKQQKKRYEKSSHQQYGMFSVKSDVKKRKIQPTSETPDKIFALAERYLLKVKYDAACANFIKCEKLISSKSISEWSETEALMAMKALDHASWLLENDVVRKAKDKKESDESYKERCLNERRQTLAIIGKRASQINEKFSFIKNLDYEIAALRMVFNQHGFIWDDAIEVNDLKPTLSSKMLAETIEPCFANIRKIIVSDTVMTIEECDRCLSRCARIGIYLGAAYLSVAQTKKAIPGFLSAIDALARMTKKDEYYLHNLFIIFHTLNDHINIGDQLVVLSFILKLINGNGDSTFIELADMFFTIEMAPQQQSPLKVALWYVILDIIQSRVNAWNLHEIKVRYQSDFAMTPFFEALKHVEYQDRLNEMQRVVGEIAREKNNEYLLSLDMFAKPVVISHFQDGVPLAPLFEIDEWVKQSIEGPPQTFLSMCGLFGAAEEPNFSIPNITDEEFKNIFQID